MPCCRDLEIKVLSGRSRCEIVSLMNFGWKPSGPGDVVILIFEK